MQTNAVSKSISMTTAPEQVLVALLEIANNFMDELLDQLPVIVIIIDENSRVLKSNEQSRKVLGKAACPGEVLAEGLPTGPAAKLRQFLAVGATSGAIGTFVDESEKAVCNLWRYCRIESHYADRRIFMVLCSDISEQQTAARRLVSMDKELAIATAVQELIVPSSYELQGVKFNCQGLYQTASEVGGDWFWLGGSEQRFICVLGDVTGHGAGPALIAAAMKTAVETAASILGPTRELVGTIQDILINFVRDRLKGHHWLAATIIDVDFTTGIIHSFNAGGPGFLAASYDDELELLCPAQAPLGDSLEFSRLEHPIAATKRLYLFSDGAYEFRSADGRGLGRHGLQRLIKKTLKLPLPAICASLMQTFADLHGDKEFEDDVTLLVCELTPAALL